jgi:hypothetical protein
MHAKYVGLAVGGNRVRRRVRCRLRAAAHLAARREVGSSRRPLPAMTSQGSVHGRFTRAIQQRNLFAAEMATREMGTPSLLVAIDYLLLLADERRPKYGASSPSS